MRNFGFVDEDEVAGIGTNAKLSEAGAAMGFASLEVLDDLLATSRRNYAAYRAAFDGIPGVRLMEFEEPQNSNCHHISIEVDPDEAGLRRDDLRLVLIGENALVRRYFYPGCHRTVPYAAESWGPLPVTEKVVERCLSMPTGTAVTPEDIALVGEIARIAVSGLGRGPPTARGLGSGSGPARRGAFRRGRGDRRQQPLAGGEHRRAGDRPQGRGAGGGNRRLGPGVRGDAGRGRGDGRWGDSRTGAGAAAAARHRRGLPRSPGGRCLGLRTGARREPR